MSRHITSDTEIEPIIIEAHAGHADVTLRASITCDGQLWEADEVAGIMPEDTTSDYVEDNFLLLYEAFELGSMTPHELAETIVNAILGIMGGAFLDVAAKQLSAGSVAFAGQSMFVTTTTVAKGERLIDGVNAIKTSVSDILNVLHVGELIRATQ